MLLTIQNIDDQGTWDGFLQKHPYDYFLQTWAWGEFQNRGLGKKIYRLGLFAGSHLQGVCLALEEVSRFGRFIYCPRGPIVDWNQPDLASAALPALKDYFASRNYLHLRLDPEVEQDNLEILQIFQQHRFFPAVKAIQVERAWVLDLEHKTEQELLSGMRKNTRYYIKRGQKSGLTIEFSSSSEKIYEFTELLKQTAQRKGFLLFDTTYLHRQFQHLAPAGILRLVTAKFQGTTLAMALVAYYGREASYLHAASAVDSRKLEPSYYLQWEAIREAKRLGLKQYNFWGVVSEDKYHPKHPGYGYSNFKRGFGGRLKIYLRPQDFVYQPLRYQMLKLQEWYRAKRDKGV